jgi:hypothetical protein
MTPPSLDDRTLHLLVTLAAPASPADIPGDLVMIAARDRDPHAYQQAIERGWVAEGQPPAQAPPSVSAFYAEWQAIPKPSTRPGFFKHSATITQRGWNALLDAIRAGRIRLLPPRWSECRQR